MLRIFVLSTLIASIFAQNPRIVTESGDVIVQTGTDGRFGVRDPSGNTTYSDEPASQTISAVAQAVEMGYRIGRDMQSANDMAQMQQDMYDRIQQSSDFSAAQRLAMQQNISVQLASFAVDVNSTTQQALDGLEAELRAGMRELNNSFAGVASYVTQSETRTNATLDARLRGHQAAITYYTQAGRKTCTRPSNGPALTQHYSGYLWGTQHNERGGGTQNLCLSDDSSVSGAVGGAKNINGWDTRDAIVPLRHESGNYVCDNCILRNVNSRIVPCAKCIVESQCFEVSGTQGCPSGYSTMYSGFLYGAYRGHYGNNERTCIDKSGSSSDWSNTGYYAGHIYPTINSPNMGRRNRRQATACHMCCKNN